MGQILHTKRKQQQVPPESFTPIFALSCLTLPVSQIVCSINLLQQHTAQLFKPNLIMKFITIASLAMASLAVGQSLGDLPSCALPCLNDAVKQSTTCSVTDVACICKKFDAIQGAAAGCILKACGQDVALSKFRSGLNLWYPMVQY